MSYVYFVTFIIYYSHCLFIYVSCNFISEYMVNKYYITLHYKLGNMLLQFKKNDNVIKKMLLVIHGNVNWETTMVKPECVSLPKVTGYLLTCKIYCVNKNMYGAVFCIKSQSLDTLPYVPQNSRYLLKVFQLDTFIVELHQLNTFDVRFLSCLLGVKIIYLQDLTCKPIGLRCCH